MGLVLASSESLDSDLSLSFLTEHRHLQGRPNFNPRAKYLRRPFHWSQSKAQARHELAEHLDQPFYKDPLPHHLALYNSNLARHRTPRQFDPWTSDVSQSHRTHQVSSRKSNKFDSAEGIALARCQDVHLPGERRPPSLERQDAFRDGTTSKRKRGSPSSSQGDNTRGEDEELYQLGILYDDEHLRGDGFSLGSIAHEAPVVWNMRYRPKKRRGRAVRRQGDGGFQGLQLALSFARLDDDEQLAALLSGNMEWTNGEDEVEGVAELKVQDRGDHDIPLVRNVVGTALQTVETAPSSVSEDTETIEERVQRIKRRIAELAYFEAPAKDEPPAVSAVVVQETVDQRIARVKGELLELRQQKMEAGAEEEQECHTATPEATHEDFSQLAARFEKYKRYSAWKTEEDSSDDDNEDWAFLDLVSIVSSNRRDTTAAVSVEVDVDDAWIMLGSDGS
ncbi:hypothetical protein B0T14DRAFT_146888 [Immersiella caudata]|uniref:Uncharacterized protein n=1 Tax=Immersiella caudata TaxID=314043 RepID=A0AA39WVC9_9PEZI|nr:hypothetical protein B0T14DRAFT_146888 [Immersiella caudata]